MMHMTWKRLFRRMIPVTLAASLLIQPARAAGQSPFTDVQEGQWFYPYVTSLYNSGIVTGYGDGRFGPDDPTRVGEAILMIVEAAGSGKLEPLQDAHYAASYAYYAVDRGWLDREQIPADLNGVVSRLYMAQLAAKALGLAPIEGASPFSDTDDGYVTALYQAGIVSGDQVDGQRVFMPDSSMTRGEISAIVWQLLDYASHIHFGSYVLDILPGVPVNSYDSRSFVLEGDRMTYTAAGADASLGVDVSYHNGVIDWEKVARDGVQFAMIRAGGRYYGSGGIFEDTQFRANIQGALDAGLEVGVYFFSQAITAEEAKEEADFLLSLLEDYDFTGPVVFDWENISYDAARTDGLDSATLTAAANAFCQTVERAGFRPMVYFNQYIAYLLYDLDGIARYPFWLAHYGEAPGFYYGFQMWQYTDAGRVDGISGPVDLNIRLTPW